MHLGICWPTGRYCRLRSGIRFSCSSLRKERKSRDAQGRRDTAASCMGRGPREEGPRHFDETSREEGGVVEFCHRTHAVRDRFHVVSWKAPVMPKGRRAPPVPSQGPSPKGGEGFGPLRPKGGGAGKAATTDQGRRRSPSHVPLPQREEEAARVFLIRRRRRLRARRRGSSSARGRDRPGHGSTAPRVR